jgi:putative cell wall-binding protein
MADWAHHDRRGRRDRGASGRAPWRRRLLALGLVVAVGPGTLALTAPSAGAASRAKDFEHRPVGQAPCPEGRSRSGTVMHAGFESAIPWSRFNNGWYRSSASTPNGSRLARSRLSGSTNDPTDYFFLDPRKTTSGRDTRLAFATRGTIPSGKGVVSVNSVKASVTGTSSWAGRIVNLTAATDDEGGWLNPWFEHRRTPGQKTRWDLDNVQIYTCRANETTRIPGADKYLTAARVSDQFPVDQSVVFVAGGFGAAISAAARAGSRDAPVLLVKESSIPSATKSALTRLNPERIVIVGGTSAVSTSVEESLRKYARSTVSRIGGASRYQMSAAVAAMYDSGKARVYVTSGQSFSRALPAAALAARRSTPLLLTRPSSLPTPVAEQLQRIAPDEIVIVGGKKVVTPTVADELARYTPKVSRIGAGNRFQTAAAVAAQFPRSVSRSYLTSAGWLSSGVTAAALAGTYGAPLLITDPGRLRPVVRKRLEWLGEDRGWVVGNQAALASIVRDRYGRTLP